CAVRRQLVLGEGLRPADELTRDSASRPALADAVLHGLDLLLEPVAPVHAANAAVVAGVAVKVGCALPDADGREMRRPERGGAPLVHRVVGDAAHPDAAVAPRLPRRPLDARVDVLRLARRPGIEEAG